jgi:carboxylesterase type B
MSLFIGPSRTAAVMSNPLFALNPNDPDTVRNTLSKVGTMFIWTCAVQANAVAYSTDANVYLYELTIGSTDPDNASDTMCTANGAVCHEDDIPLVFATYSSATSTQIAVGNEIRARWTAFAANGNPNKSGLVNWNKIGGASNLNALRIGSPSVVNQTLYSNMCGPVFGSQVLYNFQMVDS